MNKFLFIFNTLLIFNIMQLSAQSSYNKSLIQEYLQNQDYDKVIDLLEKASPSNYDRDYLLTLGYSYFSNNQIKPSKPVYLQVYDKEPYNQQANLYLGIIYQRQKNYDSALFFYKNLTLIMPQQYKYWLYCSSMFDILQMNDSTFTYVEKAYQINPKAPDAVLRYSSRLRLQKQQDKAIKILDNFLKTDSTNEEVIARRITYSAKDAKYNEVIFWGEKLLKDSLFEPLAYTDLAYAYLNTSQLDKSLALYNWMEINNMKNESLTYCAAQCYAQKRDYIKSNQLLDECLRQNLIPIAITYYRSKADNYEYIKEYKKAIAQYDTSYYIFHNPLDIYFKGRIYDADLNNKQQASALYKKYITEQKKPGSIVEQKLFDYIKEYIKP